MKEVRELRELYNSGEAELATLNANLNPNAEIYKELRKQPDWWLKLLAIKGVYVEIRKDDIVDVYYEGGRMAELRYKSQKLVATCHPKYLGKTVPQGTNPKYEDCFELLKKDPEFIIKEIKKNYSQKGEKDKEDVSEKKIQGDMICSRNPIYLDSEFAHRYEVGNQQTIRFDLVTIRDNELLFIELKRIKDNRLLNKDDDEPEILEQMDKYKRFIESNKDKLLEYYKVLYGIKKSLGLPVPECDIDELSICEKPHLIIMNTYQKDSSGRSERIEKVKDLLNLNLNKNLLTYTIEKYDL